MIKEKIAKLIDLRSIITLIMNIALVVMLFYREEIDREVLMIFSTAYGSVMTFYFTKDKKGEV
jgi:hypothetical protein